MHGADVPSVINSLISRIIGISFCIFSLSICNGDWNWE